MNPHVVIPTPAQLKPVCQEHQIVKLAVFGSALRGDYGPDSDIDVLVQYERDKRLCVLDIVDVPEALSPYFGGREIDLFMIRNLSPYIRNRIFAEMELIYPYSSPGRLPPLAIDNDTPLHELRDEACHAMSLSEDLTREDLNAKRHLHDMLCRVAARVGWRAGQVTETRRSELPGIEFEDLIGLSEHLGSEYHKVDQNRLWNAVHSDFPSLVDEVDAFLPPFEGPAPSDAVLSW